MKHTPKAVLTLVLTAILVSVAVTPATAETPVDIQVTADAYALDGNGQITSNNEFLYDSAKGDSPADAYHLAYRGNLDMQSVWISYRLLKFTWGLKPGNTPAKWSSKTFSGNWDISMQIDQNVVTGNPANVTCSALQAETEIQNPSTDLNTFIRCTEVNYESSSGRYTAYFTLINQDGSKVTGAQLDANQPASLHLTTPAQAFYVKQSAFEAGKTFTMTDPSVSGEIRMDAFYNDIMPITFDDTGNDVTLTMVDTWDATHRFVSGTPGRELPAAVSRLAPPTQTMLVSGSSITPGAPTETLVREGQGSWRFIGWAPDSAVVGDKNIQFTGTWEYLVDTDAVFTVRHTFDSTDGQGLPNDVLALTPPNTTALQGSTIVAPEVRRSQLKTDNGTWTFRGWTPERATVDGFDINFVGTWGFTQVSSPPTHQSTIPLAPPASSHPDQLARTGAAQVPLAVGIASTLLISGWAVLLMRRNRAR